MIEVKAAVGDEGLDFIQADQVGRLAEGYKSGVRAVKVEFDLAGSLRAFAIQKFHSVGVCNHDDDGLAM
jgi:hypothetical protein